MSPILRGLRSLSNSLGMAWWAEVETKRPNATYWFGPFLTKRSLHGNLERFLNDLSQESPEGLNHRFVRGRRSEPLTI
ncbi:DUF1816 domain-containing protein [Prochlorococcus sp. MIT 1341]|uniref:DUF1816 domain-containing protein n=1 Tax=Prochlorococcus sp. MIT 1341 TaxID=3096221 RepID=UPI002A75C80C|nr:DUF1816 domain-containing protein [Prochlorococcus sp. MIT 1341]